MEVALTVGGWFAAATIQILLDKVTSHALKQWGSQSGHEKDLEKLRITLLKVQPLISHAERRLTKDRGLVELLRELKDTTYAADDLLDEFEYQHFKQIVEECQRTGQSLHETTQASTSLPSIAKRTKRVAHRVCDCLSSKLSNIAIGCLTCKTNSLTSQSTSLDEIEKIVERLELIYTGVREIVGLVNDSTTMQPETRKRRETASTLEEPKVYGRDKERERIIEMLLDSSNESGAGSNKKVFVISIIGIGGVGKTTLAQYVYNDGRIEKYFQPRVWVCVSDNFDEKRIIKEIIVSVSNKRMRDLHDESLDRIVGILKGELTAKKFLLVLDDVWTDKWSTLLPKLECGEKGSKVVITCREEKFVGVMGVANKIMLEGLARDDYFLLFEKHAFRDKNPKEHDSLRFIGMQIAKKLKGSPLAAKTMGGMLNKNMDDEYWRKVLKLGICVSGEDSDDILPVLRFSYTQLPKDLQRCFAYCSIFPKDYKFDKNMLVQIWIAHGFIPGDREERLEDIGREYFDDLLHGSFFQYVTADDTSYYTMHDLMNDLAKTISMGECLRAEGDDDLRMIPGIVRHLSVSGEHLHELKKLSDLKNLRTLLLYDSDESNFDNFLLQDVLMKLKSIRTLVLYDIPNITKLPNVIGDLIHLRTLHLHFKGIYSYIKLPEALCKLYHLQALELPSCDYTLPESMNNLISLRQLYGNKRQISKIAGIGKLTFLQELNRFSIQKQSGHEISQLKDLRELGGELCISDLENVESKEEAIVAKLNDKSHLAHLKLEWGYERIPRPALDEVVFEGLQPHRNLKRLSIKHYGGVRSPNWMKNAMPPHIEAIYLTNCIQWEVLQPLGQLRFLKVLEMKGMKAVIHVDHTFYGDGEYKGFPSLEELRFKDMAEWQIWYGVEGCYLFPRLQELEIINCPKLREMPPLSPSLRKLAIKEAGLITLPGVGQSSTNNSNPSSSITAATSLSSMLRGGLLHDHQPSSLKELIIEDCKHLLHLPVGGFQEHFSLEVLILQDCPEVIIPEEEEDGGNLLLPSSLVNVKINNCGDLYKSLPRSLQNLTSLSTLEISNCPQLITLPSVDIMCHLTSLRELVISSCMKLTSLGGLHALSSLEHLKVSSCPNLTANTTEEDHNSMPSSIKNLSFRNGGNDLDKLLPIYLQNLTSLSELEIYGCPQIRSLPSAGVLGHLTSLQKLSIKYCEELTTLGPGLQAFSSLQYLVVQECPKLTANSAVKEDSLPSSLIELSFTNGGGDLDKLLPIYLQNLTSLSKLTISECQQITSLPSVQVLCDLTSLRKLEIGDCEELTSLKGLQVIVSLKKLFIENCPKLTVDYLAEDESLPSSLEYLDITGSCGDLDRSLPIYLQNLSSLSELEISDCPQVKSIPSVEVLQHLTSLRELIIDSCEELTSLGGLHALTSLHQLTLENCANLRSLPADLRSLPFLMELNIEDCPGIKSLPKKGLPTSLRSLKIWNCNQVLEERCREDPRAADWTKIAHIPNIYVGWEETDVESEEMV